MSSITEPARAQSSFVSSQPRPCHETQVMDGTCRIPRLDLMRGGHLDNVEIAWRLVGPSRGPVVAVLGGISADKTVATADEHRG